MVENIVKPVIVTVFLVKFALLVILIEKNQLRQKKLKMKIIGVGNAIVDVICNVNESFLAANDLIKGTMKLAFDKGEFEKM